MMFYSVFFRSWCVKSDYGCCTLTYLPSSFFFAVSLREHVRGTHAIYRYIIHRDEEKERDGKLGP